MREVGNAGEATHTGNRNNENCVAVQQTALQFFRVYIFTQRNVLMLYMDIT